MLHDKLWKFRNTFKLSCPFEIDEDWFLFKQKFRIDEKYEILRELISTESKALYIEKWKMINWSGINFYKEMVRDELLNNIFCMGILRPMPFCVCSNGSFMCIDGATASIFKFYTMDIYEIGFDSSNLENVNNLYYKTDVKIDSFIDMLMVGSDDLRNITF